jgi:hypothetical protein
MNDDSLLFAQPLSDEAALALSEALHGLVMACDERYYAQIRRQLALNEPVQMPPGKPWGKHKKID